MSRALASQWHEQAVDLGATVFYNKTRLDPAVPVPMDRPTLALYAAHQSPKLAAVAAVAFDVCIKERRKLPIFCD